MMAKRFITKGRGAGRKVIPLAANAERPVNVKVKVKTDPKLQLLKDIKNRGIITEQELKLVMRRLNNKIYTSGQVDGMIDYDTGLRLTPEQNRKGYEYLLKQWKTPFGVERKNNPFGYREEAVLNDFEQIKLVTLYPVGMSYYMPVYDVIAKDGRVFQYVMEGGVVKIIG